MAAVADFRPEVARLYVALFGRAADLEGLNFWAAQRSSGKTMGEVAQMMFETSPARAYYPSGSTNNEVIARFYRNVLRRTAEQQGLEFWVNKLNVPGTTVGAVVAEMLYVVSNYTGTDPQGVYSAALFNNRAAAALGYAERNLPIAGAKDFLVTISTEPGSVPAAFEPSPIEWAEADPAWPAGRTGIAFADGKFILVGNNKKGSNGAVTATATISTSVDGVNWTARALPFDAASGAATSIDYLGGRYFVFAASGDGLTSLDAQTWTPIPHNPGFIMGGATYLNGNWYIVGYRRAPNGTTETGLYDSRSTDGIHWSEEKIRDSYYSWISLNDHSMVMHGTTPYRTGPEKTLVGGSPTFIASDPAGTWQPLAPDPLTMTYPFRMAYGNGVYVAHLGGHSLATSTDLVTWTPAVGRYMGEYSFTDFDGPRFLNNNFIAGFGNMILSSPTGHHWTFNKTNWSSSTSFGSVAFGNGIYVLVSRYGYPYGVAHISVGRSSPTQPGSDPPQQTQRHD